MLNITLLPMRSRRTATADAMSPVRVAVADEPATTLSRPLLITMAVTCGLAIANLYYCQPLLGQIARSLHVSTQAVGILPSLTQIGFALAVFLIAPLGDILERRRLILTMLGLVSMALVGMVLAPNLAALAVACFAVGVTSVISTLTLPFAVSLAGPEERGATVGSVAAAMLIGVLTSRTLSGAVGQWFGWRTMYGVAAVLMVLLAVVLMRLLPRSQSHTRIPYGELIVSMFRLVKTEPLLRQATLNGMLLFGALSAFWASLVFLIESPAYHYGSAVAGLFGLVGAGGAFAAPLVGKLADKQSPRILVGQATIIMLASFAVLWLFGTHLWGLVVGVIGLDIAAQAATVSNQSTVYSLAPEAHSRLYTVYRSLYSVGGSLGAYAGVYAWGLAGWHGVCVVGIALLAIALGAHYLAFRAELQREG